ncbi:CBS domain-containing protein [Pseudomonas aeruginosa]|uniref:CBS domain-containing protein n=1 Tax=Pseudomonas aeruginosa TaxID=287 RepID=UPI0027383EB7|nr:CBS domain-containing protein [Pseudomonas aeruginosa]
MKVREIMSREVRTVAPQTTLGEAALLMRQADIGALLVNEGERLTGVVTDRDLAVRGLADGLGADRPVREVMSGELRYCFEDEEVDHVTKNMAQLEKRRLPVMDRNKRLVGIVSLANIATCNTDKLSANLLRGVARAH